MGGGLLQLVAYGAQDAYLNGNPQITFWKGLYKRHTNFAMEPFRINFTGQPNWGIKQSAIVGRHADLLYSTYIEIVLPVNGTTGSSYNWNNERGRLGYNLIKYTELEIGGQLIDRIYGEWMYLWDQLTSDYNTGKKLWTMVGGGLASGSQTLSTTSDCNSGSGRPSLPNVFYIPLYFFYTKSPGAALPLIALQYHEVKINVLWNKAELIAGNFTTGVSTIPDPVQAAVYIDYIYLDVEERRRMAQQSHEYLIEQTQYNEDVALSSYSNRVDLTFNHPVKELVWVVQPTSYTNCSVSRAFGQTRLQPFTYDGVSTSGTSVCPVYEQWLQINGQDRLDRRYGDYYNQVQLYQHHTGSMYTREGLDDSTDFYQRGIFCYSFALRPEEHQPSGTCNFSRIDKATLNLTLSVNTVKNQNTAKVRIYAVNYNVFRVMSGMGGLAYSN